MDYQKLLEKYGDGSISRAPLLGVEPPTLSGMGFGAKPKSLVSDKPSSSQPADPSPNLKSSLRKNSHSGSKHTFDLDEEEEEKLPGFVIEFRLSKAYHFLQKQEKDANKLTLKPTRLYTRPRKSPQERLQEAWQRKKDELEKQKQAQKAKDRAKGKKPKVTFWQVMKSLQATKKKDAAATKAKQLSRSQSMNVQFEKGKPGKGKPVQRSESSASLHKKSQESLSKSGKGSQGLLDKLGKLVPKKPSKNTEKLAQTEKRSVVEEKQTDNRRASKRSPSPHRRPKPQRATSRTHIDHEELVGRTTSTANLTKDTELMRNISIPGAVNDELAAGRRPPSRPTSRANTHVTDDSLCRALPSDFGLSLLGSSELSRDSDYTTMRPLSVLSTATIELPSEDVAGSGGGGLQYGRSRSRAGFNSSDGSHRLKRIISEPLIEKSYFIDETAEKTVSESRRTSAKYLYNLCNCNSVSKKSTISKLLKKKKNVSGVIDIYGCPSFDERPDALAVCPFCTVLPRKRINKWLSDMHTQTQAQEQQP